MPANHILYLFALSSLVALTGCSDKKTPVEDTTEVVTSEALAPTEVVAADSTAINEPVAEVEVVEAIQVVDKNLPRLAKVTDYFALKPNTNWSWKSLAQIPEIQEWRNNTPVLDGGSSSDPNYSINGGIDNYGYIMAYGTKNQPNIVTIRSGQGVAEDETTSAVYKLEDLFRERELTRVKSNCETEKDSAFTQHFYIWQKEGYQPFYLLEMIEPGNSGTVTIFSLAKSFEAFYEPKNRDIHPNIKDYDNPKDYNKIVCTFDS